MAVGLGPLPVLHPVAGIRVGTTAAGIKKPGRPDLVVFELAPGSHTAALFTRNAFCAAPVQLARHHLAAAEPRYLVINTGNANAGTGASGLADAERVCAALAAATGVAVTEVLPFSTGVIGEPLPVHRIDAALPAALAAREAQGWAAAASGIMTTDTQPKGASRQVQLDGCTVTITGIAKGAGMIKPNMATMLAFVATDAAIAPALLQSALRELGDRSFNRITVDSDTSTNDAVVLVATGAAGNAEIDTVDDPRWPMLQDALQAVFIELAQALVRDAEGATKFVEVAVEGGRNEAECLQVAYAIAESPLVKTALFASDPNWGRILAAMGRAGLEELDVTGVRIWINEVLIAEQGARAASYTEVQGEVAMAPEDIQIAIHLGRGSARATVWTCDLSYDYVRINAEYRS